MLMTDRETAILVAQADRVRREKYGDGVWVRGLLEYTNRCSQNCLYCGLRRDNDEIRRYSMDEEEILNSAEIAYQAGFRTLVLQGGEDPDWTASRLCRMVESIKERFDVAVTLSCGIFRGEDYRSMASAGVNRFLMRFETSDQELHRKLRDGVTLSRRLQALSDLREAGIELGSGFMVGLPGETEEIQQGNLALCRDLGLDMVGIGPFIPNPQTPLGQCSPGSMEQVVKLTALLRLSLPYSNIPATTAAGSLCSNGREAMLGAGANVLMPNVTPACYRDHYQLYPGKTSLKMDHLPDLEEIDRSLREIGRHMDMGRGDSLSIHLRSS